MQWIEVIHVRAFTEATKNKALAMVQELTLSRKPERLSDAALWIRSDLGTDISVILRWIEDGQQRVYSQVGLQLAEEFSTFGWVTHSLWRDNGFPA